MNGEEKKKRERNSNPLYLSERINKIIHSILSHFLFDLLEFREQRQIQKHSQTERKKNEITQRFIRENSLNTAISFSLVHS